MKTLNNMLQIRLQRKQDSNKGFTLIEVIVVLVIIAILAAIAIPSLTGYIDKANDRAYETEARNVKMALQTMLVEDYGSGTYPTKNEDGTAPGSSGLIYSDSNSALLDIKPEDSILFEVKNQAMSQLASFTDKPYDSLIGFASKTGTLEAFFCIDESGGKGFTYNIVIDYSTPTFEYDPTAGFQRIDTSEYVPGDDGGSEG
jgi:prepilin-type N-terminal cleavage/methylation domain-containing protein